MCGGTALLYPIMPAETARQPTPGHLPYSGAPTKVILPRHETPSAEDMAPELGQSLLECAGHIAGTDDIIAVVHAASTYIGFVPTISRPGSTQLQNGRQKCA